MSVYLIDSIAENLSTLLAYMKKRNSYGKYHWGLVVN